MSAQKNEAQGYSLALSCLNRRDYSKGIQYALQHSSIRPRDVRVHELLAQLYEGKKDWKKAIESYKMAIQMDPQKSKLGLKVVALYCQLPDEIERLRHWTSQVSKKYKDDPIIHRAWECIFKGSKQFDQYAAYIRKQLQTDPNNSLFHIKLLECHGLQKNWPQAVDQVDCMLDLLHSNEEALQQIINTCETHLKLSLSGSDPVHHVRASVNLLASLCYITQAVLASNNKTSQCVDILIRLGQRCTELEPYLNKLDGVLNLPCQNLYMSEFRGQFYYLVGTYLLQLGLAVSLPVNDVLSMTTALYALSLNEEAKRRNNLINMGWVPVHARIISTLSCNRVGQIWHFLRNIVESYGEDYLEDCQKKWSNEEGRRVVLTHAFGAGGNLQFIRAQSFLFTGEHEAVTQSNLDDLLSSAFEINQESVSSHPENFQLLIWTCLQWDTRPDGIPADFGYFVEETFGNLNFCTNKLKIMTIDNLKMLDIEAFLYAVVLTIRAMFASQKSQTLSSLEIAKKNLPLLTMKQKLSTQEQEEWFSAIFRLCHSKATAKEYSKLRVAAQRGLEVLRCGSNHGSETQLLLQLGRVMNERRLELVKSDGVGDRSRAYHAMSVMYWTEALRHLRRLANDGAFPRGQKAFFPHVHKDLKNEDLKNYIDEGSVVLAEFHAQNGEIQRGLGYLEEAKSSAALFAKASMYKQLADDEAAPDHEYQLSPTKLTNRGMLLDKAKNSLYSAMDSISGSANHPLHEEVKTLLSDIEQEQNTVARKIAEIDGTPSPPPMANESSIYHSLTTPGTVMNGLATNDPSPQRLASEIRSLNFSQLQMERDRDETKKMLELQNKTLDQNQSMMEQQNKLMEHILNMTPIVQGEATPSRIVTQSQQQGGSGDSDVLKKIAEQNEKLYDVMNTMTTQFEDLKRDVGDLKEKMSKIELEQEKGKVRELQKLVAASTKPSSQTPTSVASPAPLQVRMPGASTMPSHKHFYQQQSVYHHSGVTYVPHPQYPGYVVPIESTYHPSMMTSTPAMRRSGTSQTALPGFAGLYENGGSPTEEDEELKQQFGKTGLSLGEQREYPDTSGQTLLTSSQYPQMSKVPSAGTPMRGMLGSWQSPSGTGGSIISGSAHSPKTLGMQGQKMDAASALAAYAAVAAGQRQQLPMMGAQPVPITMPKPIVTSVSSMGGQPSANSLSVPRPIVTSVSTAKPNSQGLLIKSPTPASQPATAQPPQQDGVTQSPFAGLSFNRAGSSSSGFTSSPAFQNPKATPTTSSVSSSPFAGFSFKPSSVKTDNTVTGLGSFGTTQPMSDGGSPAQQYPQLTALLSSGGGGNAISQEDGDPDSPRPGFYAPSQATESSLRKPGQSPMSLATSATTTPQPQKDTETSTVKAQEGSDEDVLFLAERKATPEQIAKAEKLLLPPHFYLYEDKSPCPGCRGCDEEDLKARNTVPEIGSQPEKGTLFVEQPKGPAAPTTGLFSNAAFTGVSFASLSADGDAGFRKSDSAKPFTFANAGAQVFGAASRQDNDNETEDQEYDPHYEPIISLPENVDIKTGDEDEDVMFRERAKLYRFDRNTNAWKERGVGEMKILKNPETGRSRILMRREQVLKVCANHWLTPNMNLQLMSTSDRAWLWFAADFSEGEESHEQLAVKFKTPNLAADFKETFDKMKDSAAHSFSKPSEPEEEEEKQGEQQEKTPAKSDEENLASKEEDDMSTRFQAAVPVAQQGEDEGDQEEYEGEYEGEYEDDEYDDYDEEDEDDEYDYDDYEEEEDDFSAKQSLAEQFKPAEGSWECGTCLVQNKPGTTACVACVTPKPGTTAPAAVSSVSSGFNFGESRQSLAEQFKPAEGSWECGTCLVQNKPGTTACVACVTPKPGTTAPAAVSSGSSGFNFGESRPTGGPFTISSTLGSNAFGFPATSGTSSFSSTSSAFSAGSSAAFKVPPGGFNFGQTGTTPGFPASSSGSGFKVPVGAFSLSQPDTSASHSEVKVSAPLFSFVAPASSSQANSDSVKSSVDSTTPVKSLNTATDQSTNPTSTTTSPPKQSTNPATTTSPAASVFSFSGGMPQFSFGTPPSQSKPSSGFSFGSTAEDTGSDVSSAAASNTESKTASKPVMAFGGSQAAPVFSNAPAASSTPAFPGFSFKPNPPPSSDTVGDKKEVVSFAELVKSKGQFNFRLDVNNVASSPPKASVKSPAKSPGLNKSGEYYQDEERDDIYFEPVVTLPDNVKLETGEEGEEVKFSHRAKLYRFDMAGSQWKERGVGDIKVLFNPENKKYRIVMRREQVLKVCANHYITKHVDLQPNKGSEKSWVWHAMDVSDGEVQNEQLAVRFKTEEAAKEFKEIVDDAKKGL